MSVDDVALALTVAEQVHPFAPLALRLAAVSGARRSELAGLRWDRVVDGRLIIDQAITIDRMHPVGDPDRLQVSPTRRESSGAWPSTSRPLPKSRRLVPSERSRRSGFSATTRIRRAPTRSAGGGNARAGSPRSTRSGACTTCATGQPLIPLPAATTFAQSQPASATAIR